MARLPIPGSDKDEWATILNNYLLIAHNHDGTQKPASITSSALQSRSIGVRHLRTANQRGSTIHNMVLSNTGSELVWKPIHLVGLPPSQQMRVNVVDYGARGDGRTDDTHAIQAAIDAAAGGGSVEFPRGVYMVRSLKIHNKGTTLIGAARWGTRLVRLSGDKPLLDMSGAGTGVGHLRYCSVINLMLSGNNLAGVLVRSYYADNLVFRDVNFIHCKGVATDLIEVWDSRFEACTWEDCGSTQSPAVLLRNSATPRTFGFSADNTNQIHFITCRWEGFRNGALRLDGGANNSSKMLNGIFLVSCKMETSVAAGVPFQIMSGTAVVFVSQLYIAVMDTEHEHQQPVDAITDSGMHTFMYDVYVQWGSATGLARSVVRIRHGELHRYCGVGTFFPTEDPREGMIVVERGCNARLACLWSNRGTKIIGEPQVMLESSPYTGLELPLEDPGSFRIVDRARNKQLLKVDSNPERPSLHVLNGVDVVGFSDNFTTERWRIVGASGSARFASGKFRIDGKKGYVGVNTQPFEGIAMLVRTAGTDDRGLAIARGSKRAKARLMEFQDENHHIQGQAFDANGRPIAVGTPARLTPGEQVTYATPEPQVRDIAGSVTAAVQPSPTAAGTIATITFSRPYGAIPLAIAIHDHSMPAADLYVSVRSVSGFTVSTRSALRGGSILRFDYTVTA